MNYDELIIDVKQYPECFKVTEQKNIKCKIIKVIDGIPQLTDVIGDVTTIHCIN